MNDWKKELERLRETAPAREEFVHATELPKTRHYVIEENNPDGDINTFLNKQIGKVNPVFVIASHTVAQLIDRANTYCFLDCFDDTHPVIVVTTRATHSKQELADLDAFLAPNITIWDLGLDEQTVFTRIVTASYFNLCEPCTAPLITIMEDRLKFFFSYADRLYPLRDNNNAIMTAMGRSSTPVAKYKEATFSEMLGYVEACVVCSDACALTLGDAGDVDAICDMHYTNCNGFVVLDVRKARWGAPVAMLKSVERGAMAIEGNPAFTTFAIANALLRQDVGTLERYRVNRYEDVGLYPAPNKTVASCIVDDVFDWGAFNAKLTR